jgi:acyl-ACP thioesterase
MLIQIAWHHAEQLGYGVDYLHGNGLVWMLSRMHINIKRIPRWNESLKLATWPKGIRRLFYLRDFLVTDEKNNLVAESTSEWLMIDINARRPKLKDPESLIFLANKGTHAIESEVPNLKTPSGNSKTFHYTTRYSDLDLNQHLASTRYIDWMFDTFNLSYLEKHECHELILNFIHEISFEEEVQVRRVCIEDEKKFQFESSSRNLNKVFFRGQLSFV